MIEICMCLCASMCYIGICVCKNHTTPHEKIFTMNNYYYLSLTRVTVEIFVGTHVRTCARSVTRPCTHLAPWLLPRGPRVPPSLPLPPAVVHVSVPHFSLATHARMSTEFLSRSWTIIVIPSVNIKNSCHFLKIFPPFSTVQMSLVHVIAISKKKKKQRKEKHLCSPPFFIM